MTFHGPNRRDFTPGGFDFYDDQVGCNPNRVSIAPAWILAWPDEFVLIGFNAEVSSSCFSMRVSDECGVVDLFRLREELRDILNGDRSALEFRSSDGGIFFSLWTYGEDFVLKGHAAAPNVAWPYNMLQHLQDNEALLVSAAFAMRLGRVNLQRTLESLELLSQAIVEETGSSPTPTDNQ